MNEILNKIEIISKDGSLPKPIFSLAENEIKAVHSAPSPFCITQFISLGITINTNLSPYCFKISQYEERKIYHVLEIFDSIIFYHTVADIVFTWTKDLYTIECTSYIGTKNQGRTRIIKFPIGVPPICKTEYYESVSELKMKSNLYKNLSNTDKQWIVKESNIEIVKDLLFAMNFGEWNSTGLFLQHLFLGTIKKGKFTGIHHLYAIFQGRATILQIMDPPNKNGVWRAKIALKDNRTKKNPNVKEWKQKDEISTFFPNHWSNIDLVKECLHAFKSKTKNEERDYSICWSSRTESGVYVEIITDKMDNILTMYPDWKYESKIE